MDPHCFTSSRGQVDTVQSTTGHNAGGNKKNNTTLAAYFVPRREGKKASAFSFKLITLPRVQIQRQWLVYSFTSVLEDLEAEFRLDEKFLSFSPLEPVYLMKLTGEESREQKLIMSYVKKNESIEFTTTRWPLA